MDNFGASVDSLSVACLTASLALSLTLSIPSVRPLLRSCNAEIARCAILFDRKKLERISRVPKEISLPLALFGKGITGPEEVFISA